MSCIYWSTSALVQFEAFKVWLDLRLWVGLCHQTGWDVFRLLCPQFVINPSSCQLVSQNFYGRFICSLDLKYISWWNWSLGPFVKQLIPPRHICACYPDQPSMLECWHLGRRDGWRRCKRDRPIEKTCVRSQKIALIIWYNLGHHCAHGPL